MSCCDARAAGFGGDRGRAPGFASVADCRRAGNLRFVYDEGSVPAGRAAETGSDGPGFGFAPCCVSGGPDLGSVPGGASGDSGSSSAGAGLDWAPGHASCAQAVRDPGSAGSPGANPNDMNDADRATHGAPADGAPAVGRPADGRASHRRTSGRPGTVTRRTALRGGATIPLLARSMGVTVIAAAPATACANSGSDDPPRTGASGPRAVLIALNDVPVGGVASVTVDRRPAFVARPDAQSVRAFSAICTHQGCTVVSAGTQLLCPCHGSRFALLTGEVLRGPAVKPLPPIDVHIDGADVVRG